MKLMLRSFLVAGLFLIPALAFAQVGQAPLPQCQITVTPTCVQAGSRALLQWQSVNATGGVITNDQSSDSYNITPQSSLYVTPSKTSLYTATMSGPGGQNFCNVQLTVAPFGSNQCSSSAVGTGAGSGTGTGGSSNPASLNGGGTSNGTTLDTSGSANGTTLGNGPTLDNGQTLGNTPTLQNQGSTSLFPTGQTTTPTPSQTNTSLANGLVPSACAGEGAATDPNCNICAIGQLVQNIINFLLGASILVAAIMFAYAGYLFFTNNGSQERATRARKVFTSVGIGFIIALSAWLLVQTILGTLVGQQFFNNIGGGSWNSLNCQGLVRLNNVSIASWLQTSLPSLAPTLSPSINSSQNQNVVLPPNSSASDQVQDALQDACDDGDKASCTALETPVSGTLTTAQQDALQDNCEDEDDAASCAALNNAHLQGGSATNPQMAAQLAAACSQLNTDCDIPNRLAGNESTGGIDCKTSSTGAAGCMQVLATTACSVDSTISDSCSACLANGKGNSTSPACAPVIQTINDNPQLGVTLGVQYINSLESNPALKGYESQYGVCQITAAAYYAGPTKVAAYNGVIANMPAPNYPNAPTPLQYATKACGS